MMSSRSIKLIALPLALLACACGAAAWLGGPGLLAPELALARQRWERQHIDHYQIEVRWRPIWPEMHAMLEVRDERIVSGVDLSTGRQLAPGQLRALQGVFPVSRTFELVERLTRWRYTWRARLAWLVPWIESRVETCGVPPPVVQYEKRLGYPTRIIQPRGRCFSAIGFAASIDQLNPLP